MKMFDNVSQKLRDSKKIVFVTGAGISQESGIPTFRGKDGHWRKHDPMKLASIDAFFDDPKLVWEWYEDRRKNILTAKPNEGHFAISKMEKLKDVVILAVKLQTVHLIRIILPCSSKTFVLPERWCKPSIFCVNTTTSLNFSILEIAK